jgi:mannose-1-phosphate guanylyltransferase
MVRQNARGEYRDTAHDWALVLAAGDGSRLHSLTRTASGVSIPKQFCSLGGGQSLLHDAIQRARAVAPLARTCVVVAEQHRRWWQALSLDIPADNLIVQPRNRGTANGILLPLLHIVRRDPNANVLILPSDHFVRQEEVLASNLRRAMIEVERDRAHLVLLGLTPEEADPELGYIVANEGDDQGTRTVREFVEKPSVPAAREIMERGGVWNSFIFAAHAATLLAAFEDHCFGMVQEMRAATASNEWAAELRLAALYDELPALDFSRDVLQAHPSVLKVLTIPACGWSDLGTPRRITDTIQRYGHVLSRESANGIASFLDLACCQTGISAVG